MGASKKIPARGERTGVQMLATSLNVHFFKLPLKKAIPEKKGQFAYARAGSEPEALRQGCASCGALSHP